MPSDRNGLSSSSFLASDTHFPISALQLVPASWPQSRPSRCLGWKIWKSWPTHSQKKTSISASHHTMHALKILTSVAILISPILAQTDITQLLAQIPACTVSSPSVPPHHLLSLLSAHMWWSSASTSRLPIYQSYQLSLHEYRSTNRTGTLHAAEM